MHLRSSLAVVTASLLLFSCKPKPIDISVPQRKATISISSACLDNHTVALLATYSASSLQQLLDTGHGHGLTIPPDLLVDSALVTIRGAKGVTDTLSINADGIYIKSALDLQAGATYVLTVVDYRKGTTTFATTTYQPRPAIAELSPVKINSGSQDVSRLRLSLKDASTGDYFFLSYNTLRNASDNAIPLPMNQKALNFFVPKQIELFTGDGAIDGFLEKSIALQVKTDDTVLMQVARIDKAYYDYLKAYKRTGALINQLTGEPINLPTNVSGGLGYFSLYQPVRAIYDLSTL